MSIESKNNRPVVLLFGPTAVGKTALVEQLFVHSAHKFEIINADSMQVYRSLDIGTAKPSSELQRRIHHHLIDVCSPSEQYDVGQFVRDADRLVRDICSRDCIPLITGGTAFYFYHFMYGLPPTPAADLEIREALYKRVRHSGRDELFQELQQFDPVTAKKLHPNDTQRVIRALEVLHSSGKPLSSYRQTPSLRPGYEYLVLGLYRDREELYSRIDRRVEQMWAEGLVEEVRELIAEGFTAEDPGMRGIGYREFFEAQSCGSQSTELGSFTKTVVDQIKTEIKKNSRRYAKRQITFFKRMAETEWYTPEEFEALSARLSEFLREFLRPY
ncbi:MAG: tRNA (adenosine(37)-N6)-dimethylallyltransferase MiaA [Spirochaetia bacterium]|nr:tRNA (adenosine(37)-N6)-dimethylallyltransferase MiaA [Spirochaetia bacterium]